MQFFKALFFSAKVSSCWKGSPTPRCSEISFYIWKIPLCGLFYNNRIAKCFQRCGFFQRCSTGQILFFLIMYSPRRYVFRCEDLYSEVCYCIGCEKREGEIFDRILYFHNILVTHKKYFILSFKSFPCRGRNSSVQGVLHYL